MDALRCIPPAHHATLQDYIPKNLYNSPFVFVRNENPTGLKPVYAGPYKVLKTGPKSFRIRIGAREDTVSVDRLKPAYTEDCQPR